MADSSLQNEQKSDDIIDESEGEWEDEINEKEQNLDKDDKNVLNKLDPNGIKYDVYLSKYSNNPNINKLTIRNCNMCGHVYDIDNILVLEDFGNEVTCLPCFFWTNYAPELRENVDGTFGVTIAEFILRCKDTHDKATCTRYPGCFVCDYLNRDEIPNIKHPELLYGDSNSHIQEDDDVIEIVL